MIIRYAGRVLFLDIPYIKKKKKSKSIIEPLKKGAQLQQTSRNILLKFQTGLHNLFISFLYTLAILLYSMIHN